MLQRRGGKAKEEKDSCPTTTESSQRICVISQRDDITSSPVSLAPSAHPSIFQPAMYFECGTTCAVSSSLTLRTNSLVIMLTIPPELCVSRFFFSSQFICCSECSDTQNGEMLISIYFRKVVVEIVTLMMLKKAFRHRRKHNENTLLWRRKAGGALDDCVGRANVSGLPGNQVSPITCVCFGGDIQYFS